MSINTVKHAPDGGYILNGDHFVPAAPGNRHYEEIQEWIALGNTPEPAYTQGELDAQAAQAAFEAELEADKALVQGSAAIRALITKRPAQIDTWLDANVTNLNSAKDVLKTLTKVVAVLVRREFTS